MPPDHMTNPPMRFENGLETQPPVSARARTADASVANSDTYNTDLKLVLQDAQRGFNTTFTMKQKRLRSD